MKKKFGWCFIGAGRIAHKCASEILQGDNCFIASIWNRTKSKADEFANKYHAKAYDNVIDAINDPNVEGVYIAVTNNLHYEYMKLCILNHKHVLCEKPFTKNAKEAKELFELAKQNHIYIAEAMWTWFNEPAHKVKEWLSKGYISNIKNATCRFGFDGLSVKRLMDINSLGGALLDIGVYGLRYSLELFGLPKSIECTGNLSDTGIDLNETIIFHYPNFKVTHYFSITEDLNDVYFIEGDNGSITILNFYATNVATLKTQIKEECFKTNDLLYERQFSIVANEIRQGLLESKYNSKEKTIQCTDIMDDCRKLLGVIYPGE